MGLGARAALLVVLLLAPAVQPVQSAAEPGAAMSGELRRLAEAPSGAWVEVLATGPPLAMVPPGDGPAWLDALAEARAAWLDHARAAAARAGGQVLRAWPLGGAVLLGVPDARLHELAGALGPGARLGLDRPHAVRVLHAGDEGEVFAAGEPAAVVGAPEAWAAGWEGQGVPVAVVDTGVDPLHASFRSGNASRVEAWRDFVQGLSEPYDDHGHGTHVASLAVGSEEAGWRGVAPRARMLVAKVLDAAGLSSWARILDGLEWAAQQGARVVVASWGGEDMCSPDGSGGDAGVCQAVNELAANGIVVAAAAGNAPLPPGGSEAAAGSVLDPASASGALAVGALNHSLAVWPLSARGPAGERTKPDLAAPGVGVQAAAPCGVAGCTATARRSGTSMAAPIVAGAATLLAGAYFGRAQAWPSAERVAGALRATARDLGEPGADNATGWGLPRVGEALAELLGPVVSGSLDVTREAYHQEPFGASLGLENRGISAVSGTLELLLDGGPFASRGLGLAPGEAWSLAEDVPVPEFPGTYGVEARFTYAWTDALGRSRSATWSAAQPATRLMPWLVVERALSPEAPAMAWGASLAARNIGNIPALNVTHREALQLGLAPLPREPAWSGNSASPWSDPPPREVVVSTREPWALLHDVAPLPPGQGWALRHRFTALWPGTHAVASVTNYDDGHGHAFAREAPTPLDAPLGPAEGLPVEPREVLPQPPQEAELRAPGAVELPARPPCTGQPDATLLAVGVPGTARVRVSCGGQVQLET